MNSVKTKLSLLFILCFAPLVALPQANYQDVVYLKNGSVIHGIIIEQVPNTSIKIETFDKNIFVFKMDEIEKITKEPAGKKDIEETKQPVDFKKKSDAAYAFTMETHIGFGGERESGNGTSIATHFINGVTINNQFSIGAGLGFDYTTAGYQANQAKAFYDYSSVYFSAMYFIDVRAFPIKDKISPLLILNYGYSSTLFTGYVTGKSFFGVGVGTKFNFTQKLGLSLSANYKQQNFLYQKENVYVYPNGYTNIKENFTLRYVVLTVGLTL